MAEQLTYDSYTVGWICVLAFELCAARALLDEEHEPLPPKEIDDNNYFLGKMANHNIVIIFPGSFGITATAQAARTFPNIRFALMVGIGSGVPDSPNPDPRKDIRLGDVVVGSPMNGLAGVIHAEMVGVAGEPNLRMKTRIYNPPNVLIKGIRRLQLDHGFGKGKMWTDIDQVVNLGVPALEDAGYPGVEHDLLFKSDYQHSAGEDCSSCDATQLERRGARRTTRSVVHIGLIISGNGNMGRMVLTLYRDPPPSSGKRASGVDGEFPGLLHTFPFLLIKGVCDYGDSHKYNIWRPYAAIVAAAYAKDLLRVIHPQEVELTPLIKTTEPSNASQASGDTQAMGNRAGVGLSLGAERVQIKNEDTQADVRILRAESI
ncbi:vps9-ankyrin repeat protein [Trichoderma guizhouense]|uniref:Vps9-ankyrin repeat protein n=1 Tax=Trichoderma guizhouense TaxID=1491466 RepID=A0A1T3CHN3_9HYPO|nr:vps9-ankyrin repeat protein [Trichoderma guizhouense]